MCMVNLLCIQGDPIDCDTVTRRAYYREYSIRNPNLEGFSEEVWRCTLVGVPQWMRFQSGAYMKSNYI
jgi:hypothetical protein